MFTIPSGGLSRNSLKNFYAQWSKFFRSDQKIFYGRSPDGLSGYFSMYEERALHATRADPKEFFHVFPHSTIPKILEQPTWRLFGTLSSDLSSALNRMSDEHDVSGLTLNDMLKGESLVMRITYYPSNPDEVSAHAHTDANFLTLLPEATSGGLQIEGADGWVDGDPCPNHIRVLYGDMLEKYTSGRVEATRHRVIAERRPRLSVSFFANPAPSFRLDEHDTAGSFLARRLSEMGVQ